MFGLPFQDCRSDGPTPPIVGCRVTCEANVRVAEGTTQAASVIVGSEGDSFHLGIAGGYWVHTAPSSPPATHPLAVSTGWVHVTVELAPGDAGAAGGTSTVTITTDGASSTTRAAIPEVGQQIRFGAIDATAGAVAVYVDDVACRFF
jgi:hypothetical protein